MDHDRGYIGRPAGPGRAPAPHFLVGIGEILRHADHFFPGGGRLGNQLGVAIEDDGGEVIGMPAPTVTVVVVADRARHVGDVVIRVEVPQVFEPSLLQVDGSGSVHVDLNVDIVVLDFAEHDELLRHGIAATGGVALHIDFNAGILGEIVVDVLPRLAAATDERQLRLHLGRFGRHVGPGSCGDDTCRGHEPRRPCHRGVQEVPPTDPSLLDCHDSSFRVFA